MQQVLSHLFRLRQPDDNTVVDAKGMHQRLDLSSTTEGSHEQNPALEYSEQYTAKAPESAHP